MDDYEHYLNSDDRARQALRRHLARLDRTTKGEVLELPDAEVEEAAAWMEHMSSYRDPRVGGILRDATKVAHAGIRGNAVSAFHHFDPVGAQSLLLDILRNDRDVKVRTNAARYLRDVEDVIALRSMAEVVIDRRTPEAVREATIQAVASGRGEGVPAAFERILEDALTSEVKARALGAIADAGCVIDLEPKILEILRTESAPELRAGAWRALAKSDSSESEQQLLRCAADGAPAEQILAVGALGERKCDAAQDVLRGKLAQAEAPTALVRRSVQALGEIGDRSALTELVRVVERPTDPGDSELESVKLAAIEAIGKLGGAEAFASISQLMDRAIGGPQHLATVKALQHFLSSEELDGTGRTLRASAVELLERSVRSAGDDATRITALEALGDAPVDSLTAITLQTIASNRPGSGERRSAEQQRLRDLAVQKLAMSDNAITAGLMQAMADDPSLSVATRMHLVRSVDDEGATRINRLTGVLRDPKQDSSVRTEAAKLLGMEGTNGIVALRSAITDPSTPRGLRSRCAGFAARAERSEVDASSSTLQAPAMGPEHGKARTATVPQAQQPTAPGATPASGRPTGRRATRPGPFGPRGTF